MAVKKSTKRKPSVTPVKPAGTHISEPALKFIDRAASLLKQAVIRGEEETAEGRKVVRKKALTFLDLANERLSQAIKDGTALAKKGVRKL
ncbi:MAG: hypothetical protein LBK76_05195 [Verrucomicrobiales bacterium]|jgi:hypothetical protein|nr:hypothetical protein [Verrucomicrobiales bacterium]